MLFACMAVALATTSNMNLLVSRNRLESNQASALVETGLFMAQKELGGIEVSGDSRADLHAAIASHLREALALPYASSAAMTIISTADGVTVPPITLTRSDGRTGTIDLAISADGGVRENPTIQIAATGRFGNAVRTAYYNLAVEAGAGGIFGDYGLVSKSPISMMNNATIQGANTDSEGSIFSGSDSQYAIDMRNNAAVSGDADVTGDDGSIRTLNNASIAGSEAYQVDEPDWPDIDTAGFEQYVEQTVTGDVSGNQTLSNIRIPAGTNPTFDGNITLYGVVYIESPNQVTFKGNTNVCGIIVTEEPAVENLSLNKIDFKGNLTVSGVENLSDASRYDGLRDQTGTFMLAPGFQATFKKPFGVISGSIAAGQLIFKNKAQGTVRGGLLNLSDAPLTMMNNARVTIDRQNANPCPVGFGSGYSLVCITGSYRD
ncbi:MAG TPA: hypothetical protein VM238_20195 [Phycisphaerae bacterium]|nr:hypothetical protein [Phycisphaerae bacterium]